MPSITRFIGDRRVRHATWSLVTAHFFAALLSTAASADDTLTQTGKFNFVNVTGDPYHPNFVPLDIPFPQDFGGIPAVSITFPHVGHCFQHAPWGTMTASNITMKGFRASVTGCFYPTATWTAVGPRLVRGTIVPRYLVLTVIYAPPGTNGGHSSSSVSYQAGSTAGTTTSSSRSFKTGLSVSVEASGGFFGSGGGAGVSFEASQSTTDSQSLEVKKSTSSTITQVGPSQDGINHDEDEIWLLLNPTVNLALSSSAAEWVLADTRSPVQYVHVGWLNGHEAMPVGVVAALQSAGITPDVYPDILARDPFANGSAALDTSRFISINTTFPYEPPYAANDPVPTSTYNISNSTIKTQGHELVDTFKVQISQFGTADFASFAKVKLSDATNWEWTNKSSSSSSAGTSQSAQLTIGGPAYGYGGPTVVQVYFDTIYKTFAFALLSASPTDAALRGTLIGADGVPAAREEVTLEESSKIVHETVTNSKGEFAFYGPISGDVTIKALGIIQTIPAVQFTRTITLLPKQAREQQILATPE